MLRIKITVFSSSPLASRPWCWNHLIFVVKSNVFGMNFPESALLRDKTKWQQISRDASTQTTPTGSLGVQRSFMVNAPCSSNFVNLGCYLLISHQKTDTNSVSKQIRCKSCCACLWQEFKMWWMFVFLFFYQIYLHFRSDVLNIQHS